MLVQHVMGNKPVNALWSVTQDNTVFEALELMAAKNIGAVLVLEDNELIGIFSERDYARKVILQGKSSRDTRIREVMTSKVITVETDQKIEECMQIMSDKHIRHLPVNQDGKLIGIISINDIVSAIIHEQKEHISSLESYISGSPYS
ncbi:CBS domain-containing protein [Dyadobacter fanqingshengii]|jgi:CBS domain-containing protein|uniref:CBS domain-containing protein n=1 Tax=Dyadobacter fanqingshengii TaxID=2906443 RepID=A0A9X1T9X4_9BACT|nr:CBS domain-containing protein [Dyadobacter fanqingshengii]MCF0041795.1 CBS domain-containing protein [Dyadobacter fanqingshengii]MCF2504979.1 CBS domain-containing protein [Dyadobacter fanqingshengii]USJ36494.1 CBS domain-containing protein [Dyadobacter fanqingshengii]